MSDILLILGEVAIQQCNVSTALLLMQCFTSKLQAWVTEQM